MKFFFLSFSIVIGFCCLPSCQNTANAPTAIAPAIAVSHTGTPTFSPTSTPTGTLTPVLTATSTGTLTPSVTGTPTPNTSHCSPMSQVGDQAVSLIGALGPEMFYAIYPYSGSAAGTLWDMQVYISTGIGASAILQGAVYQVSTGNQIGLTPPQSVTTNGNFEWTTLDMNSPGTLLNGQSYYLCLNIQSESGSAVTFAVDQIATTNFYTVSSFSGFASTYNGGGTGSPGEEPDLFIDYCP